MPKEIKISVIIPVFDAEDFITQAVISALQQSETGEVVLIEDGSRDGSLKICQSLENQYEKIKLLRHTDGKNHGAAASRNLGIVNAAYSYIAFLDADDYYVKNRFAKTIEVINSHENVEGIYEAIGAVFQTPDDKVIFLKSPLSEITSVNKDVTPEKLFFELIEGKCGYFSFIGLTISKNLILRSGLFNENLEIHEDSDLMFKLSALGRLLPGNIQIPVAMRRVHSQNRITHHYAKKRALYKSISKLWASLYAWGKFHLDAEKRKLIARRYIAELRKVDYLDDVRVSEILHSRIQMLQIMFGSSKAFTDPFLWRLIVPSRELFLRKH
ncbi:MAG: glycosyltransferase family 2 protein [Chloroflexi bacterium]|nr:glycosyltransferase family 2 protein [Chloroflexota bacterium]